MRAERERVRKARIAECMAVDGYAYHDCMECGDSGAARCVDAIDSLDLDALSENAPSR